jgi:arogenate dehydrogenase (NADP+), plant
MGVDFYSRFECYDFLNGLDVVILAVPLVEFEEAVASLPVDRLRGKLIVDVCPLNSHPKAVLLRAFDDVPDIDILCSNPMFGPANVQGLELLTTDTWDGRPMVYEKVRVSNVPRCDKFLKIFEEARCRMLELSAEQHDSSTADAEFVTHLVGRLLNRDLLPPTPVMSKEYTALREVAEMTAGDSFDMFFGMFKYNARAKEHLANMRDSLANVERQLAAREAYLEAKAEMKQSDRQRLMEETRLLLLELAKSGGLSSIISNVTNGAPALQLPTATKSEKDDSHQPLTIKKAEK